MQDEIAFYRATGQHGFLSNLHPCKVVVEGIEFRSSEHAYQYGKPNKPEIKEWIRAAPHPRLAAIAGHGLFHYDIVDDWKLIKVRRMKSVLLAKFRQNPGLLVKLLVTGEARLVEASKTDAFWGIGRKRDGKNMLGILLMEVRKELKDE